MTLPSHTKWTKATDAEQQPSSTVDPPSVSGMARPRARRGLRSGFVVAIRLYPIRPRKGQWRRTHEESGASAIRSRSDSADSRGRMRAVRQSAEPGSGCHLRVAHFRPAIGWTRPKTSPRKPPRPPGWVPSRSSDAVSGLPLGRPDGRTVWAKDFRVRDSRSGEAPARPRVHSTILEMLSATDALTNVIAYFLQRGRLEIVADQQGKLSFGLFTIHGTTFSSVDGAIPWRFTQSR